MAGLALLGFLVWIVGVGFSEEETSMTALYMVLYLLLLPLLISCGCAFVFSVARDTELTQWGKQGIYIALLVIHAVVLHYSSQASMFECFPFLVGQCTLSTLSMSTLTKTQIAQIAPTWTRISRTNTVAMLYFCLALVPLPSLSWQVLLPWLGIGLGSLVNSSQIGGLDFIPRPSDVPAPAVNPLWKGGAEPQTVATGTRLGNEQRYAAIVRASSRSSLSGALCGFLVVLPFLAYLSTRLGNFFEWFYPQGLAVWTGAHNISPAIPTVAVGPGTSLKIYPQMLVFYLSLYCLAGVALLAQRWPRLQAWLQRRLRIDLPSSLAWFVDRSPAHSMPGAWALPNTPTVVVSCGQLLVLALFLAFIISTFYYVLVLWYFRPRAWFSPHFENERWGRALGQTCVAVLGLVVLPVSRNSIWTTTLGVPWEAMLVFHRFAARVFLLLALAHMLAFWLLFASLGVLPSALFSSPNTYQAFDFTITPMSSVMLFVVFPAMGLLTREGVRRRLFAVFYVAHHYAATVLLLASLWHANFGWYYIVPGLLFWAFDNVARFHKACRGAKLSRARILCSRPSSSLSSSSGQGQGKGQGLTQDVVLELSFLVSAGVLGCAQGERQREEALQAEMGQYVFLSVREVGEAHSLPAQLHPFSLCSSPLDPCSSVCVRAMCPSSGSTAGFTQQLALLLANRADQARAKRRREREADASFCPEAGGRSEGREEGEEEEEGCLRREGVVELGPELLEGLTLVVDGPYGVPFCARDAPSLLLIAGGVGITPLHSVLRTLLLLEGRGEGQGRGRGRAVRLVWGVRNPLLLSAFSDTWDEVQALESLAPAPAPATRFSLGFHCSQKGYARQLVSLQAQAQALGEEEGGARASIGATAGGRAHPAYLRPEPGRVDLAAELSRLVGVPGALCVVSGPPCMVQECQKLAVALGVQCRGESFVL